MFDVKECCGNCKYHRYDSVSDGYICVNDESDNYADFTEYGDECGEFEERE